MSKASNQLVMGVDPSGVRTSISHQESDANEDILRIEETRKVADDSSAVLPELIQQVDSISRKIADGEKVSKLTIDGAKILGGYASEKFGILTPAVISGISTEKLFTYAELNGVARVTTEDLKTLVSVGVEKILIFIENMLRYITKMGHTFKTSFKAGQYAGVYHSLSHGHYNSALSTISNAENLDMSKWNSELNPLFAFMGTKGAIDKSTFLDGVKAVVELYIGKNVSNLLLDVLKVIAETITHVDTISDPKTMLVTIRNKVSEVLKDKVSGNELTLSIKNISTNFNKEGQDYINANHCYIVGINGLHVHVLSTPKELQENSKPLVFHTLTLEAQIDKQAIPFLNAEEVGKDMLIPVNNIFNGINNESLLASEKTIHDLLSKCRVIYASNKNGHTTQETSRAMVSASIIDILKVITEALQKHMLTKYTYPFDMCIQYLKVAYAVSKGNTTHEGFFDTPQLDVDLDKVDALSRQYSELIDIRNRLDASTTLSPLQYKGMCIQVESIAEKLGYDVGQLTVSHEGITDAIKNVVDRLIIWLKEQFDKLKEFLSNAMRDKHASKVEEVIKDIETKQEELNTAVSNAHDKLQEPVTIDLVEHPKFLHILGVAARFAGKDRANITEHDIVDLCRTYLNRLIKLLNCDMASHLTPVIEKVANDDTMILPNQYGLKSLSTSMTEMFDKLNVYAGSPNFVYGSGSYTAGVNDKMFLSINNDAYLVGYHGIVNSKCYKEPSTTKLTLADPMKFCDDILTSVEAFHTVPKPAVVSKKTEGELRKILDTLMIPINKERDSARPDVDIINKNKLIYNVVKDVYRHGYASSALNGMYALVEEVSNIFTAVLHAHNRANAILTPSE